ncbi:MAG: 2-hydroxyglutaryl-CoA dehydratase [Thermoplasmata archaeon]|nr:MAG: 2-hydroxyglutaryl-CoA dehydratase [Thermoplasmata archaeon]
MAGLDVGAITIKSVIMKDDKIVGYNLANTGMRPGEESKGLLEKNLNKRGLNLEDVNSIIATGHGRHSLDFTEIKKSEITCIAKGAKRLNDKSRMVVDIGGQGIRVIELDEKGDVSNFLTNDKCSAGTGCFLDMMSYALQVDLDKMGELSLNACEPKKLSTTCSIFAESEVVSLVARGMKKEDILAGLHDSVARKVTGLVKTLGVKGEIFLAGGVARNIGVRKALESRLNGNIYVARYPQIVCALGAALIAQEEVGN